MCTIIFDLETSGLNPYHDDIIEIGEANKKIERLENKLNSK